MGVGMSRLSDDKKERMGIGEIHVIGKGQTQSDDRISNLLQTYNKSEGAWIRKAL